MASLPRHLEHFARGEVLGAVGGDDQRDQHYADQVVVEVVLEQVEGLRGRHAGVEQVCEGTSFLKSLNLY